MAEESTGTLPPPATAAGRQRRNIEAVYVVQIKRELDVLDGEPAEGEEQQYKTVTYWQDVPEPITVAASTKRRKVFALALEQIGYEPQIGVAPPTMRALDSDSAHETTPELDVQLRIG